MDIETASFASHPFGGQREIFQFLHAEFVDPAGSLAQGCGQFDGDEESMTKTFEELKAAHRAVREGQPSDLGLRIHRALSWLDRAERSADDLDIKFTCLWIAFNASYVEGKTEGNVTSHTERGAFFDFFAKINRLDTDETLYKAFWSNFSGPVRLLMQN